MAIRDVTKVDFLISLANERLLNTIVETYISTTPPEINLFEDLGDDDDDDLEDTTNLGDDSHA